MRNIPDSEYSDRIATLDELRAHTYKSRVNIENRNRDYSKFAVNREECSIVIWQNIEKGWHILNAIQDDILPDTGLILGNQLNMLSGREKLYVLSTCVYFIAEYNPQLLK